MTKFLSLLLVLTLAVTALLAVRIQSVESSNDSLAATVTQLKTDTEAKLKELSTAMDGLTGKVTGLEQGQHAASAPPQAPAMGMTPPVMVSPPGTGAMPPPQPGMPPQPNAMPPAAAAPAPAGK